MISLLRIELERDLSFSCLNLSLTSLNLTNLLWLLFLFISFLIRSFVSPPAIYCHTARLPISSDGPQGLSVRLSRIDITFLFAGRFLKSPRAPCSYVITFWMALSLRGIVLRMLLASLIPFFTVLVCVVVSALCSFLWLCAERISLLFLRSL